MIPLIASDISAGQMVMLHALAACKPVIITDTATVRDYAMDHPFITLVPAGNTEVTAKAIRDMSKQLPVTRAQQLSIRNTFEQYFSDQAHDRQVRGLLENVSQ